MATASNAASSSSPAYKPGPPSADQVKRAAAAFGAEGEHNGVSVGFGGANEVPPDDTANSEVSSPDGISFDARFDNELLKGPAMQLAISHVGSHIADIRGPQSEASNLSAYGTEFRAWQTTILSAMSIKKSLILPGGYPIYNPSWASADIGKNAYLGISEFLGNWAAIGNLAIQ